MNLTPIFSVYALMQIPVAVIPARLSAVQTHLYSSVNKLNLFLLQAQPPGMGDPGMPGGDPDLPETPLDSGVYILIIIALIYGVWRIRALRTTPR